MERITRLSLAKKLVFLLFLIAFSGALTAQVKIGATNYATFRQAITAISSGTYANQNVVIEITANVTETNLTLLSNAGNYLSITIRPSAGGNKTLLFSYSGNANTFSLFSAHDISFEANADGSQLTIAATTAGMATLDFNGCTNITVKNCTLLGSGGSGQSGIVRIQNSVLYGWGQNYTIRQCVFGPYDTNLPITGINAAGTTDNGYFLKNVTIDGNSMHDFASSSSSRIASAINVSYADGVNVTSNRIYQTAARTTDDVRSIYLYQIVNGNTSKINGNIIGAASGSGIGDTQISCAHYAAIYYSPYRSGAVTYHTDNSPIEIASNFIRSIRVTAVIPATTSTYSVNGIYLDNGSANLSNNTIGNQSFSDSFTVTCTNGTEGSFNGINLSGAGNAIVTNNTFGGMHATTSSKMTMTGISLGTDATNWDWSTCTGNTVGGTSSNSLINDSTHAESTITGIYIKDKHGLFNLNTVRNITGYGTGFPGGINRNIVTGISREEYLSGQTTDNFGIVGNTVNNLLYGNTNGLGRIVGIFQRISHIEKSEIKGNNVYGLTSSSLQDQAEMIGIYSLGIPSAINNNLVAVPGNATSPYAETSGITIEEDEAAFYNSSLVIKYNSVCVSGQPNSGTKPSRTFRIIGDIGNGFWIYNNIFVNNASNSGSSTRSHYSIEVPAYYHNTKVKYWANVYYGTGNGYVLGYTDSQKFTLAQWNPAPEYYGYVSNPQFINPTGTPPDLHINTAATTIVEGHGNADSENLLTDIDGQTRSGLTPIDIGADAGNFIKLNPPVITGVNSTALCTSSQLVVTGTGLSSVTEAKIGSTVMAISNTSDTSLTIEMGIIPLSGSLTVTNPLATVTYPTTINIYAAPVITLQPVSVITCSSGDASFTVGATNVIAYQWRRDGVNLTNNSTYSNVNSPTLNITGAGSVPFGSIFDVVMTGTANGCSYASSGVTLTANILPSPIISASGPTTICPGGSVTLSTDYNGPAAQLTGATNYLDFTRHINYDFTVEYWIKTTQTGGSGTQWYNGQGIVDAKTSNLPQQCEFGTSLVGNKLAFGIAGFNALGNYSPNTIMSATTINTGQWIHVAVTRRESTGELKIYINGILDASGTTALRGYIFTPNMRIGGLQTGGNYFNGGIDDVRVWSYVRSQAQIVSGMSQSYPSGTAALVDNFPLNENTGFTTANLATGTSSSFVNNPGWINRATTSNYTAYSWSNGAHTPTINVTTAGNYSVEVTDQNGCSGSWTPLTVTVQSVSVSPSAPTICQNASTTLTASGGANSYTWSPATGLNTTSGASVIATPSTTTTYTVTGIFASGCQTTKQVTVTVIPTVTISASQLNVLPGGSATLTASGGSGFTWSPVTGLNTASGASVIATPAVTTTYTVTSSTCSTTATVTITVLPASSPGDNALDFDGTDDYVSIPAQTATISGSFTVEAWIKPTHPTKTMHVISSRNGQDFSFDIQIKGGNTIHGDIGNGSSWLTTAADATFNYQANTWMHILYVVTPADYKIYANGNLVGGAPLSGTPMLYSPTRSMTIGKSTTENTFFQGTIDDIRVYNTALTGAQVQSEMLGNYQVSGLLAYYSCNEGVASGNNAGINTLVDQNIAGNFHGTLHNFTLSGTTSNWVEGQSSQQQFIEFLPLPDVVYGAPDFILTGTATSGLPVSYSSSNPQVASVAGNIVTIHHIGTTEITATQNGNSFYLASDPVSQLLTVTPKALTLTNIIVGDKIYDRTTSAVIAAGVDGIVGSDSISISVDASFTSSDAGNDIPVTMELAVDGAQSVNYTIEEPTGVTGNILPKPVTITGAVADYKIYDGTTAASVSGTLSGIISPDVVSIATSGGTFASANANIGIPVTANFTLGGIHAGNYVITQPGGLTAGIIAKPLTVNDAVADNKAYDGTLEATISGANLSGIIFPDEVTIASNSGTFASFSIGNGIAVTPNLTLGGSAASNYSITQPIGLTANITPIELSAIISGNAMICLNTSANLSVAVTGTTDTVSISYTDGTEIYTLHNYHSGNPIAVSPFQTSTYTLVSVGNATAQATTLTGSVTVTVDSGTTYYADTDSDGFGDASSPVVSCTGQPANTVSNNTDCAPTDPSKWRTGSFYVDADNDGFYNGNDTPTSVCYGNTNPSGFTTAIIGADCNDNNAEVNANHVEVLDNGIDDNCSGVTDENIAGTASYVQASQCGITLNNITNTIYAYQISGATGYRFEVTNGSTVRTYDAVANAFSLLNLSGAGPAYATTYSIRVAAKTGGFWRAYGNPCTVTTPANPATTTLATAQCGSTIAAMSTTIYCNQVTAASMYRFEVSGGSQATRTYDSAFNRFAMTNLSVASNYATTYSVRVAMLIGGVWQDYGSACSITTPASPATTSVIASECGITITNSWTTIYCNPVAEATGYRFEVKNGAQTRFADVAVSRFSLWNLAGGPAPGTVYSVRVAILYNGVYQAFGPTCTITTAAVITRQSEAAVNAFAVKASSNPFANTFKLDINTSSEDRVEVKVYDMIGKLVEARQSSVAEMGTLEVGSRFPSGVYNIVVTQGENVKTLRVIKR